MRYTVMEKQNIQQFSSVFGNLFSAHGFKGKGSSLLAIALSDSIENSQLVGFFSGDSLVHVGLSCNDMFIDCHGVSDEALAVKKVSSDMSVEVDRLKPISLEDVKRLMGIDVDNSQCFELIQRLLSGFGVVDNIKYSLCVVGMMSNHAICSSKNTFSHV